jgi:hypothetical protein
MDTCSRSRTPRRQPPPPRLCPEHLPSAAAAGPALRAAGTDHRLALASRPEPARLRRINRAEVAISGSRASRACNRRYLKPNLRCLRCSHSGPWASARTRYLKRCLCRSRSGLTFMTRHFLLSLLLLRHRVTSAATCLPRRTGRLPGLLPDGLQITAGLAGFRFRGAGAQNETLCRGVRLR